MTTQEPAVAGAVVAGAADKADIRQRLADQAEQQAEQVLGAAVRVTRAVTTQAMQAPGQLADPAGQLRKVAAEIGRHSVLAVPAAVADIAQAVQGAIWRTG